MLPLERAEYETEVAALRKAMEGTAWQKAWQAGRALDMDTAVDLALSTKSSGG